MGAGMTGYPGEATASAGGDTTDEHPEITTSSARSRCGGLAVVTTIQGLPLTVRISESQLVKSPAVLAEEILRLCKQSSMAAGISLRAELIGSGVSVDVVDSLGLPRPDELARMEMHDDHADDAPASWLRPV